MAGAAEELSGSSAGGGSGGPQPPLQPRRKISLPWFRQSSFGLGAAGKRLPKQHTIAVSDRLSPPDINEVHLIFSAISTHWSGYILFQFCLVLKQNLKRN